MIRFGQAQDPRRRKLIRALAAGAFSSVVPAEALAQVFGRAPGKLPPNQSIFRLSGDVQVNDTPATMQTRIEPGDTLQTGGDGEVVYVVGENAFLLRAGSRVTLERGSGSMVLNGFRLITGAILSVFPKQRPLTLQTGTATIGIRGTGAYMEAEPARTYLCLCYGLADVTASTDPQSRDTVATTHHEKPIYILSGEPAGHNIRPAGFVNHTDQELMLIESLVGRTAPFVFPKDAYKAPRREY